jgi:excisionase family DNA binding protein
MDADVARLVRSPGALEAALVTFLQAKTSGSVVPVERRVFLTMAEAVEFSGLPASFLRRLIVTGKLKALKTGAGWRVSRAGIEGLSDSLTEVPGELTEHELRDLETNRKRRLGL